MLIVSEFVLAGLFFTVVASLAFAKAAVHFRRAENENSFMSTTVAVILQALFTAGYFCLGRAVIELSSPWIYLGAAIALMVGFLLPYAAWRVFGPPATETAQPVQAVRGSRP